MYSLLNFLANEARQNTMHQVKITTMTQVHPLTMYSVPELKTLKGSFPGLKTLLFDMDGTLFDTEKYHTLALQKIGHDQKIVPPIGPKELHELMMGKADHLLFEIIKDWEGFPEHWDVNAFVKEKNDQLLKILSQVEGSSFFSVNLRQLLLAARQEHYQVGLVTSSEKVITNQLLKLAGFSNFFSYILTRDDSLKVKPDPWPYLEAMKYFAASPETTLIFEDSLIGIEAARSAGAHVIKAAWY